jgi:RES domain-containing protein
VRVWRLCQAAYSKKALTGEGGLYAHGRWHLQGVRVVYAAATLSLAALELLVRIDCALAPPDLVAVEIEIPGSVEVERKPLSKLPAGWDAYPAPASTQLLGMRWIAAGKAAVLEVPSALIPREWNYILNPAHPHFARVRVVGRAPFFFDSRLLT